MQKYAHYGANKQYIINLLYIGKEMVLFKINKKVCTFYFVYIQCIIQIDGEYPTDDNWSTSLWFFTLDRNVNVKKSDRQKERTIVYPKMSYYRFHKKTPNHVPLFHSHPYMSRQNLFTILIDR